MILIRIWEFKYFDRRNGFVLENKFRFSFWGFMGGGLGLKFIMINKYI